MEARAGLPLKGEAGEVTRGADAGDAGRGAVQLGLEPGEESFEVVGPKNSCANDQERLRSNQGDRREIAGARSNGNG